MGDSPALLFLGSHRAEIRRIILTFVPVMRMYAWMLALLWVTVPASAEEGAGEKADLAESKPAGVLTGALNQAVEKAMTGTDDPEKPRYGRNVTQFLSPPKVTGYFISSYKYSDRKGSHGGEGFGVRHTRVDIRGTVMREFAYRVQMEFVKSVYIKDAYLEWTRFREARVRFGQFHRCFTYENPMYAWDVGVGDYSQAVKKLSGFSDYAYSEYGGQNSGRDIGLQVQGDLLPVGKDRRCLLRYQAALYNGQGIHTGDANGQKDFIGNIQMQPLRDLYIAFFGWKGNLTVGNVTVQRNRWALSARYERKGWVARAEYIHHTGHKISDYDPANPLLPWRGNARADGWYATLGVPCTDWLRCFVKYDVYRDQRLNRSKRTILSLSPNIQLHKHIMFQLQYNHVHDPSLKDERFNELWAQAYLSF